MVAYSFKRRFVEPIRAGTKRQTIRMPRRGRSRHARVGELVQLYCGLRTSGCFKILEADPICMKIKPLRLQISDTNPPRLYALWEESAEHDQRVHQVGDLDAFARVDGFDSALDMAKFWLHEHGPGTFANLETILWEPA